MELRVQGLGSRILGLGVNGFVGLEVLSSRVGNF